MRREAGGAPGALRPPPGRPPPLPGVPCPPPAPGCCSGLRLARRWAPSASQLRARREDKLPLQQPKASAARSRRASAPGHRSSASPAPGAPPKHALARAWLRAGVWREGSTDCRRLLLQRWKAHFPTLVSKPRDSLTQLKGKGRGGIPAPPFCVSIIFPLDVVLGGNAPGVQRRGELLRELLGAINVRLLVLPLKASLEDLCLLLGRI